MRRLILAVVVAGLALAVAACGSSNKSSSNTAASTGAAPAASSKPGAGKPAITLGDKNFTEQFILGQLYKQALEAKGFTVNLKPNIGSSELIDKSLTSGQIDMYPEYTGVILAELAHNTARLPSDDAAYQAAKKFEEGRGFTLLDKTPFFDTDALAVLPAYAQKNNLKSIADLAKLPKGSVKVGAPPEFATRFAGLKGLKSEYGVELNLKPLTIGLQYKALDSGKVDTADVFTTDGQLQGGKYVLLDDPKNVFGFQNVAPVVSQKLLDAQGPAFAETLNTVSSKLTDEAMRKMNAAVDLDKQDPAKVAQQFLAANGLA
jgi:osmoprotectant transport system substrate-binding protein